MRAFKFQVGPITRKRKNHKKYLAYQQESDSVSCIFCDTNEVYEIIYENDYVYIAKNKFSYDVWDGCSVEDHVMVVPRAHVSSLGELDENTLMAIVNILAEYEIKGYSIYARSVSNVVKSIDHQHTHLMKLGQKRSRFMLYLKSPHLLLFK